MKTIPRLAMTAVATSALAIAGLGLDAGTAQADGGPYRWCPGESMSGMNGGTGPGPGFIWDMSRCHTWWALEGPPGRGNVPNKSGIPSNIWDGDAPPPGFSDAPPPCALFICRPG